MTMSSIPPGTEAAIQLTISAADRDRCRQLLAEVIANYPSGWISERVLLDIVYGSGGDIVRFEYLTRLAKRDWRDLIMETEYEKVDGKIVRKKNLPSAPG